MHDTQAELDDAYRQLHWVDRSIDQVVERAVARSNAARANYRFETHAYGPHADEVLDIFPAAEAQAPVHVLLHGGT